MPGKAPKQLKKWASHKLECLTEYIAAQAKTYDGLPAAYIEPFYEDARENNPPPALKTSGFAHYIFVARNSQQASHLKKLATTRKEKIHVVTGRLINESVLKKAYDVIPRSMPSLALADPLGYRRLRWSVVSKLAAHGQDWKGRKTDILIIFPLEMSLARNLTRPECAASITRLFGNSHWLKIKESLSKNKINLEEARQQLLALYKKGLKELGYRHVSDQSPAPFSNPPVYHVIHASDRDSFAEMLADVWSRPRYLPGELFAEEKLL